MPHGYKCPNEPCIKLENPKLEYGGLFEQGVILLSVGCFLLVFVLPSISLCIWYKRKGFVWNKETAVGMPALSLPDPPTETLSYLAAESERALEPVYA